MTTSVPETVSELLTINKPLTAEQLAEKFAGLSYEEQDNLIMNFLVTQLNFHKFLLQKSLEGDKKLPDTQQLYTDVAKLEVICNLYQEVQ